MREQGSPYCLSPCKPMKRSEKTKYLIPEEQRLHRICGLGSYEVADIETKNAMKYKKLMFWNVNPFWSQPIHIISCHLAFLSFPDTLASPVSHWKHLTLTAWFLFFLICLDRMPRVAAKHGYPTNWTWQHVTVIFSTNRRNKNIYLENLVLSSSALTLNLILLLWMFHL